MFGGEFNFLGSRKHQHRDKISTFGMNTIRFWAQELEMGTISQKMVEPQLEGDKVVDLNFKTLG